MVMQLANQRLLLRLHSTLFGDVAYRQQDQVEMIETAAIEEHDAPSDRFEVVLYLDIIKGIVVGKNVLHELPQFRNVPLPISKFVHQPTFGMGRGDLRQIIEGLVRPDPQISAENQQPFTNAIDQLFQELPMSFELEAGLLGWK
ncbi:hypothetical protein BMJ34_08365 [Sinorhizobium medicae]|uniref:Uncharacterized protein n=3 Tax=Sinorhizobium medicae TaxID=110321 RepID=A0ABX4TGJ1_9HYPH|nr:hypothetical protein [Sinorhizobium medicae]PLT99147.1 hypothetical protein BMJ33_24115 [Sinorhizobium medicae]PLU04650.1 hypothetical protein BMJ34_08365 [Sinorhizobium medicae]PLU14519.1 hypothetical protein BMJ30_22735 [Sinorhizobium medicae]PLU17799.1 hypothetical protein BMJ29_19675 [Sinorhizobium medicae]PLU29351.1 hypothetical protein BMJ27_27380 [Sinorhizobium medicae]